MSGALNVFLYQTGSGASMLHPVAWKPHTHLWNSRVFIPSSLDWYLLSSKKYLCAIATSWTILSVHVPVMRCPFAFAGFQFDVPTSGPMVAVSVPSSDLMPCMIQNATP